MDVKCRYFNLKRILLFEIICHHLKTTFSRFCLSGDNDDDDDDNDEIAKKEIVRNTQKIISKGTMKMSSTLIQ